MLGLLSDFTDMLAHTVHSPWLWLIVFGVAGLDALLPFMPSETTVVTVAVLVQGDPGMLVTLAFVATIGAVTGDCLGYLIGRTAGIAVVARLQRGEQGRRRYEWARGVVQRQAPMLIMAARYIPGGRAATSLATGSTRYPARKFVLFDLAGAGIWATYSTLIGWIGGRAFEDKPLYGLLLAFAIGLTMVGLMEIGRRALARRGLFAMDTLDPVDGAADPITEPAPTTP